MEFKPFHTKQKLELAKDTGHARNLPGARPPFQANRESVAQKAHVIDLYTYLAARAEGSQGPGRPER